MNALVICPARVLNTFNLSVAKLLLAILAVIAGAGVCRPWS